MFAALANERGRIEAESGFMADRAVTGRAAGCEKRFDVASVIDLRRPKRGSRENEHDGEKDSSHDGTANEQLHKEKPREVARRATGGQVCPRPGKSVSEPGFPCLSMKMRSALVNEKAGKSSTRHPIASKSGRMVRPFVKSSPARRAPISKWLLSSWTSLTSRPCRRWFTEQPWPMPTIPSQYDRSSSNHWLFLHGDTLLTTWRYRHRHSTPVR